MSSPEDYFNTKNKSENINGSSSTTDGNGSGLQTPNSVNIPRITLNSRSNSNSINANKITSNSRLGSPTRQQLDYLKSQAPAYKQIKIKVDPREINGHDNHDNHKKFNDKKNHNNDEDDDDDNNNLNLQKSVSFDTIAKDILDENNSSFNFDEDDDDLDFDFDCDECDSDDELYNSPKKNKNKNKNDELNTRGRQNNDPSLSNFLKPGSVGGGNERMRSPSPYSRDLSPNGLSPGLNYRSGSFSSLNNIEGGGVGITPLFDEYGNRIDYPTRPVITHDALTWTFKHLNYNKYVKENEEKRSLIVWISGRRHTWVALDYLVANLLHKGDHIVIMTRVPERYRHDIIKRGRHKNRHRFHRSRSRSRAPVSEGETNGNGNGNNGYINPNRIDPSIFRNIAENLKKYMEFLIDDKFEIKITIDIVLGESTKNVLKEAVQTYDPHLIITSTKPNLKFQRKHTWTTSRISDRLVKCFQIPIIVVPAFTLNEFEVDYFKQLTKNKELKSNLNNVTEKLKNFDLDSQIIPSVPSTKELSHSRHSSLSEFNDSLIKDNKKSHKKPQNDNEGDHYDDDDDDDVNSLDQDKHDIIDDSDSSIYSTNSEDSEDSTSSSLKDLTRTISNYKDILDHYIEETESKPLGPDSFLEKLNKVTDTTHKISLKFAENSDGTGSGAELVRSLTGLPQLVKHKSMLDDLDLPNNSNEEALGRIKNSLYSNNGSFASRSKTPLSFGDGGSGGGGNGAGGAGSTGTPKTIKFSNDISTPDKLKTRTKDTQRDVNNLRKFKSHVETNPHKHDGRSLSPSMSQPQSTLMKSLSESKIKTLKSDDEDSDDKDKKKKKKSKNLLRNFFSRKR